METITEETIYKQLSGSAAGAIAAVLIGGVIVGGCAVFCGTQLGWTNLLTVILLVLLALCAASPSFALPGAPITRRSPSATVSIISHSRSDASSPLCI